MVILILLSIFLLIVAAQAALTVVMIKHWQEYRSGMRHPRRSLGIFLISTIGIGVVSLLLILTTDPDPETVLSLLP